MKKQKIRHFFKSIKDIIPVIKKSCLILAIMGFIGVFYFTKIVDMTHIRHVEI